MLLEKYSSDLMPVGISWARLRVAMNRLALLVPPGIYKAIEYGAVPLPEQSLSWLAYHLGKNAQ